MKRMHKKRFLKTKIKSSKYDWKGKQKVVSFKFFMFI